MKIEINIAYLSFPKPKKKIYPTKTETSKAKDAINVLWFMQEIWDNRDQMFYDKQFDVLNRRDNNFMQL